MRDLLWIIPASPFLGFLVLALAGARLPKKSVAVIGTGAIGVSALISLFAAAHFLSAPPPGHSYSQTLWTWIEVDGFRPAIGLYLDALSVVMVTVVSFVAFFIHLYSSEFMAGEEGYSRFFAYMNLFVGSMLTLVLADNLLL
ncbi:MAG TPA: hypothetical protein VED67_04735, partial [Thermodesulfovibrionales bacterium]|nr:hypothetical protein [Thermodesulfovibrionales bacterium]